MWSWVYSLWVKLICSVDTWVCLHYQRQQHHSAPLLSPPWRLLFLFWEALVPALLSLTHTWTLTLFRRSEGIHSALFSLHFLFDLSQRMSLMTLMPFLSSSRTAVRPTLAALLHGHQLVVLQESRTRLHRDGAAEHKLIRPPYSCVRR